MKQWTPDEIRDFRQKQGILQKDFAKMLRISVQHMCYLEKGVRNPSNTMRALLDCVEREHGKEKGKGVKKHGSKGNL